MSSTIIRISLGFRPSKKPIHLSLLHAGRPSALTNEDLSILEEIIGASTSLYLDQMQQKLSYVREVVVSDDTPYTIVWLRHMSRDCFPKRFDFHKIMQRTVKL